MFMLITTISSIDALLGLSLYFLAFICSNMIKNLANSQLRNQRNFMLFFTIRQNLMLVGAKYI